MTQDTQTRNGSAAKPRPGRPWWRPLVDGIDSRITPPANNLVRTNVFADTVAVVTRLEVRVRRRVERQSTWLLHQYNLPTAGDIKRVRAQLSALEARIRDISERLEDEQRERELERAERKAKAARPRARAGAGRSAT